MNACHVLCDNCLAQGLDWLTDIVEAVQNVPVAGAGTSMLNAPGQARVARVPTRLVHDLGPLPIETVSVLVEAYSHVLVALHMTSVVCDVFFGDANLTCAMRENKNMRPAMARS